MGDPCKIHPTLAMACGCKFFFLSHPSFPVHRQPVPVSRKLLTIRGSGEQAHEPQASNKSSDPEKEILAAKLAIAEAKAEALKRELSMRKGGKDVDFSKLKPAIPEKRIDGTGYREALFSAPGKITGAADKDPSSWGLLETELFLSKGASMEGSAVGGPTMDEGMREIITRRLLIGLGIAVGAIALSFLKLPAGLVKPSKPLFFYLGPMIHLRDQLKQIEESVSDANSVREKLQQVVNSAGLSKDTFISAAAWLEGADAEKAISLTYLIFDYLNQADYKKYFEPLGIPSPAQQQQYLKFSLQSIKVARENLESYLSLMPQEAIEAATNNIKSLESGLK